MISINFESFLEEKYFSEYTGDKEHWESSVERWMENLDVQELIDYAEEYGQYCYLQGKLDLTEHIINKPDVDINQ